jgi:hypothetical protein
MTHTARSREADLALQGFMKPLRAPRTTAAQRRAAAEAHTRQVMEADALMRRLIAEDDGTIASRAA